MMSYEQYATFFARDGEIAGAPALPRAFSVPLAVTIIFRGEEKVMKLDQTTRCNALKRAGM